MSWKARTRMFDFFCSVFPPDSLHRVLDVGVTPDVELRDSNFFEQLYPYKDRITAVSIEDVSNLKQVFPTVEFKTIPVGPLPFKDDFFDVVFCSAVIEHVGNAERQREFLLEVMRVSRCFFITTPNRWYPIEFHTILPFIHWLPKRLHRRFLKYLGYDFLSCEENLNLLSASEIKSWGILPKKSVVSSINFIGLPSNIIIYGESYTSQKNS